MQAVSYEDIRQTSSEVARDQEREAFDRGIALMEAARDDPEATGPRHAAIRYMQTLWSFLIRDLSDPANGLSDELKGNLMSIGLWTIRESDAILAGQSDNWAGLIDINRTVREGLSA